MCAPCHTKVFGVTHGSLGRWVVSTGTSAAVFSANITGTKISGTCPALTITHFPREHSVVIENQVKSDIANILD